MHGVITRMPSLKQSSVFRELTLPKTCDWPHLLTKLLKSYFLILLSETKHSLATLRPGKKEIALAQKARKMPRVAAPVG